MLGADAYATTVDILFSNAPKTGELRAPFKGKVSWTAQADLAEAAAVIHSEEGQFDGPVVMTGSEMLDLADADRVIARTTQRVRV